MITSKKRTKIVIFAVLGIAVLGGLYYLTTQVCRTVPSNHNVVDSLIGWDNSLFKNTPINGYEKIEVAKALAGKDDHQSLSKIYEKQASFEKSIHQYFNAIKSYQKAINEIQQTEEKKELPTLLYKLGDCYKKIGEYNSGFKATLKALRLFEEQGNKLGLRRCHNNLGSFYKYLGDYPRALEHYQKALKFSEQIKYQQGIASAYNNIGTIYSALDKNDLALLFYNKSMQVKHQNTDSLSMAIYYTNISSIYVKQNRTKEAYAMLLKARKYYNSDKDPRRYASHLIDFGEYYQKINQLDSAIACYEESKNIVKRYKFQERMLTTYKMLAQAYFARGDYKKASENQAAYLSLNKQLLDNQKSLEIARLENDFEERNSKLIKDNATLKLILLLIMLTIIVITLTLSIIFIGNKHKKAIKTEKQIQQNLEDEKEKVESDLSKKNRELTLFSLQQIQHKEANEALVEKLRTRLSTYSAEVKKEISSIINELERESTHQSIWNDFEHRFIEVNPEFYAKLQEQFPDLTQNEKRICAFLKLNMTTKEISTITGQSPHSINVARTRLRRKIGINNSNAGLSDFITSI